MVDEKREMCLAVAGMSCSDGEGKKMLFVYFLNAVQTVPAHTLWTDFTLAVLPSLKLLHGLLQASDRAVVNS